MARGKMKQPSKAELREQLATAQALVTSQAEEIASLRQGMVGEMFDAPVLMVVGITEASTPFAEIVRPTPCPPVSLDVMAAHVVRMATAAHAEPFKIDEMRIADLETRMDGLSADLKGMRGELLQINERIEALAGIAASLVQGDEEQ